MNQPFTQDELKMILNGIEWAIDHNEGVWSRERHLQYHTLLDRVKGMTHEPTPAEMARDAVRNDREMQFLTNFGIRTASGAILLSPHHAAEYARLKAGTDDTFQLIVRSVNHEMAHLRVDLENKIERESSPSWRACSWTPTTWTTTWLRWPSAYQARRCKRGQGLAAPALAG